MYLFYIHAHTYTHTQHICYAYMYLCAFMSFLVVNIDYVALVFIISEMKISEVISFVVCNVNYLNCSSKCIILIITR